MNTVVLAAGGSMKRITASKQNRTISTEYWKLRKLLCLANYIAKYIRGYYPVDNNVRQQI